MKKFIFSPALLLILLGCSTQSEIPLEKLAKIHVDLMVVQQYHADNSDSLKIGEQQVFEKYNITKENYDYSLKQNSESKEKWEEFFKLSLAYLDSLKAKTDSLN